MKCTIPEIVWHNRGPVLSVDIECKTNQDDVDSFWRLASGGTDSHVLIWHLSVNETGAAVVNCVADLTRHQKAVNVVRFSPNGEILASGDDVDSNHGFAWKQNFIPIRLFSRELSCIGNMTLTETSLKTVQQAAIGATLRSRHELPGKEKSVIILWKQKEGSEPPPLPGEENINKEQWMSWKVLRGHLEDVYDISWSPDCNMLVSGSVDNTAIVWDIQKGRSISILQDYKGFVQGVAWDPCNQYIATLSTDRHCRLIDVNSMKTVQRVHKAKIPTSPGHSLENKVIRLFHDDTFKSFFRRLGFTIDGSLIIAPSGIIEPQESTENMMNATIVFSRHNIKEPIMILPSLNEPTIAVKCCPVYFELRGDGPVALIALPYRLVFAVATQKSVLIYDTQQISPIAVISNIHYTRLTDVVWSSDGRILVVSSTDGYCSIIHFEDDELGKVYKANKPIPVNNNNIISSEKPKANEKTSEKSTKKNCLPDVDDKAMDVDVSKFKFSKKLEETKDVVLKKNEKKIDDDNKNKIIEDKKKQTNEEKNKNETVKVVEDVVEDTEDLKLVFDVSTESLTDNENNSSKNSPTKIEEIKESPPPRQTPSKAMPPSLIARTPRRVQLITLSSPNRKKASEK